MTTFPTGSPPTFITVTASYAGATQSASLNLSATALTSFSLNPGSVPGGMPTTGTVMLTGPAPPGGAIVSLSSGNTAVAIVPGMATVPAGASSVTFQATTYSVATNTPVAISASYDAGSPLSQTLTVTR